MKFIDSHAHIWGEDPRESAKTADDVAKQHNQPDKNIESMLNLFERNPDLCRIGISPLFGGHYPNERDIIEGNDKTADCVSAHSDKFFGYFTVNPCLAKNAISEIGRAAKTKHIHGIKIWVSCRGDREEILPVIGACIDKDLPILIHAFYKKPTPLPEESTPDHVAVLAAKCPRAKIIMAHIGMDWSIAVRAAAEHKNVYTDISGSILEQGAIEKAVKYLGAERVMFGTDLPYGPLAAKIGMLKGAGISDKDKSKIAFENANNLFELKI